MKKVMVFGVFDGLHEGHRAFLKGAENCGDYLIAVVAQNHIVEHLKGRLPTIDLTERLEKLRQEDGVDEVVIGDSELETWEIVKKYRPEIIAVGYDQNLLKQNLEKHLKDFDWQPEIKIMNAYRPDKYHSGLLNSEDK